MATINHITLPDNTDYSIQATGIFFGQVDSTSTSTIYTATIPGVTEYYDGLTILLKNGIVTSASGFTININNLGAKPSYSNMATGNDITPTAPTQDTTIFNINYTMLFVYDSTLVSGGAWICYRGYNSDTNTIAYQVRTNNAALKTTDRTRYYRILFSSADNTKWVPANTQYDNSATSKKTVNTRKINPFGRIVYLGNSTNYAADAVVAATALWHQYAVALGYSFNRTGSALTLTSSKPVYVKCAPQTDGSAIMDSTTPIVQNLPSTEDGKIYIFLGIAYSATNIELFYEHPVYYYKDGAIRLWANAPTVSVPTASNSTPAALGTASAGTSTEYSRADHVHAKPTKVSEFENDSGYIVGVTGTTYETMFGGVLTATTATDGTHSHPHANTGINGRIDKRYSYRVTFDGDEYILPAQLACMEFDSGLNSYTFEYLGDISLYRASMDGTLNQPFDVPFLIVSDDEENDGTYSIHVYTDIAGEHTAKIEKIVLELENIPPALIYKSMYVPFEYSDSSSTYQVFSVGCNKFIGSTTKSGYAFGYDNKISENSGMAFGQRNEVSGGHASIAIGYKNTASGEYSHANGWRTVASGSTSYSEGFSTVASGGGSHAEGANTKSGGDCSHAEGDACRTLARGSHAQGGGTYLDTTQAFCHVGGVNNETSLETGKTVSITRYNQDGTVASTTNRTLGKYAEVIGNGDSDNARSNARTLDWNGNEKLAGGLTLGMGTANETSISAAQLSALLAGGLPTPTASDNGKFVMVVNGAYALATVPDANGRSF